MSAGQRETRKFRVVERCSHPACRRVTGAAIVREGGRHVIWIARPIEVCCVAAVTIYGRPLEFAADVARGAIEFRMHAGQREACDRRMIERSTEPVIGAVTGFASRGEIEGLVVNHAGRVHVVGHVAGGAVRSQAGELSDGGAGMARDTVESGVRSKEREAILVILHVLNRDVPALHRVTFLTARSELAAMQVRMAIHALGSDIRKNWVGVAGLAI